jgi:type I restriction enzyme, S subunit
MQINIRDLRNIKLSFPSLYQQKILAAKLDEVEEETQLLASLYQRKLTALDALKKSLLHRVPSLHSLKNSGFCGLSKRVQP